MSASIRNAKNMIDNQLKQGFYGDNKCPFLKYSKLYLKTNENISAYLKFLEKDNLNSALTVLSSGDHLFNLLCLGVKEIDTFDSNIFTSYYALGLKKAMILKYNYKEYIETFLKLSSESTTLDEITSIILDLTKYMENEHQKFWSKIAEYNYKEQNRRKVFLNILLMFAMEGSCIDENNILTGNRYLQDEEAYNITKTNLNLANISFKNANAVNLSQNFSKTYDTLLLSNIPDYFWIKWSDSWQYNKLKEYEEKLFEISNENATIFLNYIFGNKIKPVIKRSYVYPEDLIHEEIKVFPSISNYSKEDSILLIRKREK